MRELRCLKETLYNELANSTLAVCENNEPNEFIPHLDESHLN